MTLPLSKAIGKAIIRGGVAVTLAVLFLGASPAPATALVEQVNRNPNYWMQNATRSNTTYSFIYRQAPQAVPSTYAPVSSPASSLTTDFRSLPSSNPVTEQLRRQSRTISILRRLSPFLRGLGAISLGPAAAELGIKLGTGINAKWLKVGLDASPLTGTYTSPEIDFRSTGQTAGLWNQIPVPENAWVWSTRSSNYGYQRSSEYWSTENTRCPSAGPPPQGFTVIEGPLGNYCDQITPIHRRLAFKPENALRASSATLDYTNQPYERTLAAPTPPPQATVEQGIRDDLEKPENAELRQWFNYKLGSPGEHDPTGLGAPNPRVTIEVPNCADLTFDPCSQLLRNEGFAGTITRENESFEEADVTKPADAVLDTAPATGSVDADGEVVITTNPSATQMPVIVPEIQPDETYEEYAERVRELDLVPVREDATEIRFDYRPDGAISTNPGTGARVHKDTEVRVIARPRTQRCDLSPPLDDFVVAPALQSAFDPFIGGIPEYPSPAISTFATPLSQGGDSTTLRWGTTFDVGPPDLWDGFGYRHIAAKHGWSPADEHATRDVLLTTVPVHEPNRGNDRWLFAGPSYLGLDGRPCQRFVVVDYGIAEGNSQPEGIITSFGRDLP